MENKITLSEAAENRLAQLQEWIEVQKTSKGLADIQFCPYELRKGEAEDYIEDAYNMILAYESKKFTDISDLIL